MDQHSNALTRDVVVAIAAIQEATWRMQEIDRRTVSLHAEAAGDDTLLAILNDSRLEAVAVISAALDSINGIHVELMGSLGVGYEKSFNSVKVEACRQMEAA